MSTAFQRSAGALLSGLVFGAGLVVSGMSNPKRVLSFLNLRGGWDPSLLLVMLAATSVYFAAFRWSRRRSTALNGDPFTLSSLTRIDARLVCGAALFGAGWGLSGLCPAPSIIALPSATPQIFVFVLASLVGSSLVARLVAPRASAGSDAATNAASSSSP